ncbi:MAG: hypothetical protein HY680_09545 [Chloroflexi bacterium]|nr:hypothetical protein [Chloroflexota bacterium]
MLSGVISAIVHSVPNSTFKEYSDRVQHTDLPGAPTAEEARQDYQRLLLFRTALGLLLPLA